MIGAPREEFGLRVLEKSRQGIDSVEACGIRELVDCWLQCLKLVLWQVVGL